MLLIRINDLLLLINQYLEFMEFRQLRSFLVLGKTLHFNKAADRLFISQPALTKQIQQLEAQLEVKLFLRSKRKVALTPAGEYLMKEAEYMLNHIEKVTDAVRRKAHGEEGEIRIGFVGSAMQEVIPDLLEQLHRNHPDLHTSLHELDNRSQLEALGNDKLDIGFVRLESIHSGFAAQVVSEDSFSLVVSNKHEIGPDHFEDLTQFAKEQFIFFSNDYSQEYFDKIYSLFDDHGFVPRVSHRSVHSNTIFRLVERKLGVAIVPSALAHGVDLGIHFISLAHLPQRTRLMAVWPKERNNETLLPLLSLLSSRSEDSINPLS